MLRLHRPWLMLLMVVVSVSPFVSAQPEDQPGEAAPLPELRLVASIKPLALIAQDLLGNWGQVEVLVKGAASPHDYALKVSDMRILNDAHLLIWMGPELERFLEKAVAGLSSDRRLSLGHHYESPESGHEEEAHVHNSDLHQWLDPRLAQDMARAIAKRLQHLYPSAAATIEDRLAEQLDRYEELHKDLKRVLTPVADIGFVVQHRGYDLFVQAYHLNQVAWISTSPEQPPGVRHLYELEKSLETRSPDRPVRCLFVELSHESQTAGKLADQLELKLQGLDILGETSASYPEMMRKLARDFIGCLSGPR